MSFPKSSKIFQPLTVSSFATGTWESGDFTKGAETTQEITASVQPLNYHEAKHFEVADMGKGWKKLYTETELYYAQDGDSRIGDRFTYRDITYEIVKEAEWQTGATLDHHKYLASKLDPNSI